ncbi:Zn-dependent protease with chaperone function [Rubidibacter lacunae KORDI 51-2]|uniref:Zn-dependent protease with chaperone function n=1 Tax=Rubidibacter lacunae KORDI 51-2 TaxID=582515 RepID=U5DRG7_9CHRO|nr:M48 family metalloprotease [Rubidibacter lacunae]ERN42290.1 Zn-dependent protease with chaperone function [Rubidibacter lacunae KORDI 51-2]
MNGEPTLEVGEAALARGDYDTAIAHLESFCAIELDEETLARGHQALVVAYTKSERVLEALKLCRSLSQGPDSAERRWLQVTIADLEERLADAEETGANDTAAPQTQRERKRSRLPVSSESAAGTFQPEKFVPGREWRRAGRAKRWSPLKRPGRVRFWAIQLASAIVLFLVVRASVQGVAIAIADGLRLLPFPVYRPRWLYGDPAIAVCVVLIVSLLFSTWALDRILQGIYGLRSLSMNDLVAKSPEAVKLLQRYCRQRKLPVPNLGVLPAAAPFAFGYGLSPRSARLILSEGALDRLEDDEIASLCAAQLFHIASRETVLVSGFVAFLQIPYLLYRASANLGTRGSKCLETPPGWFPAPVRRAFWPDAPQFVRHGAAWLSAGFYGAYWLWRLAVLWSVRRRAYYADRFACNLTGNPNGHARALLKVAEGTAAQVKQFEQTSWLLESFNLLLPLGPRQAIGIGSVPERVPFETVLGWECTNPYRHWLKFADTHPLLGDRLFLLGRYATHWQLQPEVELPIVAPPERTNRARILKAKNSYRALPILQSAVLAGLVFGLGSRLVLWLLSLVSLMGDRAPGLWWLRSLDWLQRDPSLLNACIMVAISLSLIVWVNGYFPDIKIEDKQEPRLYELLSDRSAVPPNPQPVRLSGKLLGRRGLANWAGQDLVLFSPSGAIALHWLSALGQVGNLLPGMMRPCEFVGRKVTVTGWLRRGPTPWIDVDTIAVESGPRLRSGHPVWITVLAVGSAAIGAYAIAWG